MLKCLRHILVTVAVLIALSVLVPMAYIEGSCRPAAAVAASAARFSAPLTDEPLLKLKRRVLGEN